jgi:hypothetical protein
MVSFITQQHSSIISLVLCNLVLLLVIFKARESQDWWLSRLSFLLSQWPTYPASSRASETYLQRRQHSSIHKQFSHLCQINTIKKKKKTPPKHVNTSLLFVHPLETQI